MRNEDLRAIIESLEDENGRITPERVLEEAQDGASPLHPLFEWDDGKAAHKFRLDQARSIIRRVEIHHSVENRLIRGIAYVHDPDAPRGESRYISVRNLRRDQDASHAAMTAEFASAGAHLRRARDLARVLGHGEQAEEILRVFDTVTDAIHAAGNA